jgi:hypothetical protein
MPDDGVQFMRTYLQKMTAFDQLATEISAMVQEYTSVRLESQEETGLDDRESNERIIQGLNREEPHSVDEDFTYKRPHGFILCGQGASGLTTWQRVYELVCQQLLRRDPLRGRSLVDHPDFISNRGHHSFSRDPAPLRKALEVESGLYAESNRSANGIRDIVVGRMCMGSGEGRSETRSPCLAWADRSLNLFAKHPWYAEESDRLVQAMEEGGEVALHRFILFHRPLVNWVARRFTSLFNGDVEDAAQSGVLGLLHAARRYDRTHRFLIIRSSGTSDSIGALNEWSLSRILTLDRSVTQSHSKPPFS